MDRLTHDLRFAFRTLGRNPGFATTAILTLALGIGATTAIFSLVQGVVLRPLAYPESERIVSIQRADRTDPEDQGGRVSPMDLGEWRAQASTLGPTAIYNNTAITLTGMGEAELVMGASVSPEFFDVFAAPLVLGRAFTEEEDRFGAAPVAVVGHGFWREQLGGREDVVGSTFELSGRSTRIVGVAPPGFDFPDGSRVWVPVNNDEENCGRGCSYLDGVARLAPGATLERAREELRAIALRLEEEYPSGHLEVTYQVERLQDEIVGDARQALVILFLAVGMVLLIACANMANLLLARGATRTGEVAVRAALGAGRRDLIWQVLRESLALALLGGAAGVVLAYWGVEALRALQPGDIPRLEEVGLNGATLLFALLLVVATALLFGLAPATRLARQPVSSVLRRSGRGDGRGSVTGLGRSALLMAEVGLSLLLLIGAGLLLRSFATIQNVDPGYRIEDVALFNLYFPEGAYAGPDEVALFYSRLEPELEAIPGVEAVMATTAPPLGPSNIAASFRRTDLPDPEPGRSPSAAMRYVDAEFFDAMEIPVLEGRAFEPTDRQGAVPVIIVSESAAREFFPDGSPIGKQLALDVELGYDEDAPRTVVGVVADVRARNLTEAPRPTLFVPFYQTAASFTSVLLRVSGDPAGVLAAAREAVHRIDPDLPINSPTTMPELAAGQMARPRFMLLLVGAFALLALTLAAVGIYGVVAYLVASRTREIGIRMALGAARVDIARMVLRQGMLPAAIGIAIGLVTAFGLMRLIRSLLYGVQPQDPLTLLSVVLLLLAVVGAACLIPTLRAVGVAPATALRAE